MNSTEIHSTVDVPGLLAQAGAPNTSDRYKFISTQNLVDRLGETGWIPREAFYKNSRKYDPLYGRHCIRFSKHARELNAETPEIVVFNSHDGKSSAQITSGMFRLVCSNGMVIMSEQFDNFRIPHRGYKAGEPYINYAIKKTAQNLVQSTYTVDKWKDLLAPFATRKQYYTDAIKLRFPNASETEMWNLDMPQRKEDESNDMWTMFNRTQEYIMNGGFTVTHTEGKKPRLARELTSVEKVQSLNEQLWQYTEDFVGSTY